jgi:L-lactate permease
LCRHSRHSGFRGGAGRGIIGRIAIVSSSATNQQGKEAAILKTVFWHSIALASIVASIVMFYA